MRIRKSPICSRIKAIFECKPLQVLCRLMMFAANVLCLLIWTEAICRNSYHLSLVWLLENTSFAALCAGFIALILAILIVLLGRMAPAVLIGNVFFLLLSFIHRFKLDLRGDPLQFTDLFMAREAMGVVGAFFSGGIQFSREMIIGTLLTAALLPLLFWGMRISSGKKRIRCIAVLALCAACFPYLYLMASTKADNLIVTQDDYTRRGFLVAFADRLPCFNDSESALTRPENYDKETVSSILSSHRGTGETPDVLPNILFIMSESLYDLSKIFQLSDEPSPYFKQLQQEHWGGEFHTVTYGGGTANVEYEVLTGYRTADTPGYGFNILGNVIQPEMDTIVSLLESYGYFTQAIHPNAGSFYDRQNVYKMMGFDSMLFSDTLDPVPKSILNFPPDDYLFDQIIKAYKSRPDGKPWFCHAVTYQNHAGYGFESNFDAIEVKDTLAESPHLNVHNFANMLRLSDDALRRLIAYFEACEEPTLVVVWGDHAPAINQFGLNLPSDPAQQMLYYSTPILVYSNYGADTSCLPSQISSHRLGALITTMLGMDRDPYFNYLSAESTPNLTLFHNLIARDGTFISDPEAYQQEKEILHMIHYDRLNGKNNGGNP